MTIQIETAPEVWGAGATIYTDDRIAIRSRGPQPEGPKPTLYISEREEGFEIRVDPSPGCITSSKIYRVVWDEGRLEDITPPPKPKSARFLFIGGALNGELVDVPVGDDVFEVWDIIRQAKIQKGPHQELMANLLRKRLLGTDTQYTKRQVVHEDKPGRSMPIFVENKILENDKWLEDIEPSILDQLWLKDGDGNPVGHEPLEEAEQPHPHLCFEHGGSIACEEHNAEHGFECPKCVGTTEGMADDLKAQDRFQPKDDE